MDATERKVLDAVDLLNDIRNGGKLAPFVEGSNFTDKQIGQMLELFEQYAYSISTEAA